MFPSHCGVRAECAPGAVEAQPDGRDKRVTIAIRNPQRCAGIGWIGFSEGVELRVGNGDPRERRHCDVGTDREATASLVVERHDIGIWVAVYGRSEREVPLASSIIESGAHNTAVVPNAIVPSSVTGDLAAAIVDRG